MMDEKTEYVISHIGSSNITKTNYDNINAEDLPQQVVNIGKNIDRVVLTTLQCHLF